MLIFNKLDYFYTYLKKCFIRYKINNINFKFRIIFLNLEFKEFKLTKLDVFK